MFMNNILIIAKIRLKLTNSRMEIYLAEGLMLNANAMHHSLAMPGN
jgi:hypothetical protein